MEQSWRITNGLVLGAVIAALLLAGCAPLQLPAIDPSGQRIFLPRERTTIQNPLSGLFPRPAFPAATTPPPCPASAAITFPSSPAIGTGAATVVAPPTTTAPALPIAQVQQALELSPTRVVAPVGSEVVLVSGLRETNGRLAMGQPIEWLISQDSAGHFVQVDEEATQPFSFFNRAGPRKVTESYAQTRTSSVPRILTRGTVERTDDLLLQQGQTWASVTSPTEGTTYVTVVAQEKGRWEMRRQTARIHWVDAQWTLPAPVIVKAGERSNLITTVTRSSGLPEPGNWIVNYEVVGGVPAVFGGTGQNSVDIPVDTDGRASIDVWQQTVQPGTSQVRIQIIRPAAGNLGKMVLGQGEATVTWSAPGLTVNITGPRQLTVGTNGTWRVDVINPGDIATTDVVVGIEIPAGVTLLQSQPEGSPFGQRVEWRLAELPPRGQQSMSVECRAETEANLRFVARARSADGLNAEAFVESAAFQPSLSIKLSGPEEAEVGQEVQYIAEVINTSTRSLANVLAVDEFDEGLEHTVVKTSRRIERDLGRIDPGVENAKRFPLTFVARQPGQLCHTLTVTADRQTAKARTCLNVKEPPRNPGINATIAGPVSRRVDEVAAFTITVRNTGNIPLTGLELVARYGNEFRPVEASLGWKRDAGRLYWLVDRLEPGEVIVRQYNSLCQAEVAQAVTQLNVTTDQNLGDSGEVRTEILPRPAPPITERFPTPGGNVPVQPSAPVNPPAPQPQPPVGKLEATISVIDNPIRANDTTKFIIHVQNASDLNDADVTLTLNVPDGLMFVSTLPQQATSPDNWRTVQLTPVRTVRPREQLPPFEVVVKAVQPGTHTLTVQISSTRHPQAVVVAEDVTVLQ